MAQQLRENPLLAEILEQTRLDIMEVWEGSPTVEGRERCWTDLQAVERLKETLDARTSGIISGDGDPGTDGDA